MEIDAYSSLITTFKVVLCGLFLIAGLQKLAGQRRFRNIVADYDLLPVSIAGAAATAIPLTEITAAFLILTPGLSHAGLSAAAGLLTLYIAALGSVNLRQMELEDCGCGGFVAHKRPGIWPIARNTMLILVAAACLAGQGGAASPGIAEWATALPLSAFILLMYWSADGLWANRNVLAMER